MHDRSLELLGTPLLFEERVIVAAPADYVYRRWTDFPHLPEFMDQVKEIRPVGADRYHWVAQVLGTGQEWDVSVTDREINRRVAWRSLNGPHQAMAVSLRPLDGQQTEVLVRAEVAAPEGEDDAALDRLRQAGQRELQRTLERFQHSCALRRSVPAVSATGSDAKRLALKVAASATAGALVVAAVWLLARRMRRRQSA